MLAKLNPFSNRGIARPVTQVPVFDELFREADRVFDGSLAYPAADIYETADGLVLTLDVPGCDPKALDIQVEGDVLTVQAQRQAGPVSRGTWLRQERALERIARSFVLPNTVDASKCEATCAHGVLTLSLPKREEAKPRSISVKVHS